MSQLSVTAFQTTPIAILGASARSAAASAVRSGFQPITADLFADADLRQFATATRISPYPDGFLDWLCAMEPPAWMYTGALENHPGLVDQMAWIAPLWGNPGDVLGRVRSPWELAGALSAAGLLFPETRATFDGLPSDGSWLAKTYRGASGSGVREWTKTGRQGDQETRSDLLAASAEDSPFLVFQRRINGIPLAAVFVAAAGSARLLGVTRQLIGEEWLGAHGFQYAGSLGPWPISESVRSTIAKIGNVLAAEFELIGLFGVDMILDGETIWTLEVNPRYTASVEIVERATGVNAIAAHSTACATGPNGIPPIPPPRAPNPSLQGKAIVFAKRDIEISDKFAEATLVEALHMPWPTLADVSAAGTLVEQGRPVLTLFAEGGDAAQVLARLRERIARLESELYASC